MQHCKSSTKLNILQNNEYVSAPILNTNPNLCYPSPSPSYASFSFSTSHTEAIICAKLSLAKSIWFGIWSLSPIWNLHPTFKAQGMVFVLIQIGPYVELIIDLKPFLVSQPI